MSKTALEAFREIEDVAARAMGADESRHIDYLEEIKHLAFSAARREEQGVDKAKVA
jgi:hypothetical protein